MQRILPIVVIVFCVGPFSAPALKADSIELRGGGQVVGDSSSKPNMTLVAVDDEFQIAFENTRVRRRINADELSEYRQRAERAGDDAQAHYELARWCAIPGNVPGLADHFKRYHLQRAILGNPNHPEARAALRYRKERGEWIKVSELYKNRGMVSLKGKWDLPEAIAHHALQAQYDTAAKAWTREIKKSVSVIRRGSTGKRFAETMVKLKAIDDPRAAEAVSEQLISSRGAPPKQSRELRRIWVELLGRFKNSKSVETLVREGLDEPDQDIRERALDQLTRYGSSSAKASYRRVLVKNSSHDLINRAARALTWFPDRELASDYVRALITKHTRAAPTGPQYQVGFGDNQGANQFGNKKKVITETKRNPAVLTLVKQIIPEQDFGYDEKQWLEFLANEKLAYTGDLRRDP